MFQVIDEKPYWWVVKKDDKELFEVLIVQANYEDHREAIAKSSGNIEKYYNFITAPCIKDWKGVTDSAGSPVPFTPECFIKNVPSNIKSIIMVEVAKVINDYLQLFRANSESPTVPE